MKNTEKDRWKRVSRDKSVANLPSVYDLPRTNYLALGLWCLYISKNIFKNEYITHEDIETILNEYLDIPIDIRILKKALASSFGSKIIKKKNGTSFKISNPGEIFLEKSGGKNLNVLYINPDRPREAKNSLDELIKSIPRNKLYIYDPYYGINTFNILESFIKYHKKIFFLTRDMGANEKKANLSISIKDFKKQYKDKIEIKVTTSRDIHDRYIISGDKFFILGHGLKDLGDKESLIVVIHDSFGKDIKKSLVESFMSHWKTSTDLII